MSPALAGSVVAVDVDDLNVNDDDEYAKFLLMMCKKFCCLLHELLIDSAVFICLCSNADCCLDAEI